MYIFGFFSSLLRNNTRLNGFHSGEAVSPGTSLHRSSSSPPPTPPSQLLRCLFQELRPRTAVAPLSGDCGEPPNWMEPVAAPSSTSNPSRANSNWLASRSELQGRFTRARRRQRGRTVVPATDPFAGRSSEPPNATTCALPSSGCCAYDAEGNSRLLAAGKLGSPASFIHLTGGNYAQSRITNTFLFRALRGLRPAVQAIVLIEWKGSPFCFSLRPFQKAFVQRNFVSEMITRRSAHRFQATRALFLPGSTHAFATFRCITGLLGNGSQFFFFSRTLKGLSIFLTGFCRVPQHQFTPISAPIIMRISCIWNSFMIRKKCLAYMALATHK